LEHDPLSGVSADRPFEHGDHPGESDLDVLSEILRLHDRDRLVYGRPETAGGTEGEDRHERGARVASDPDRPGRQRGGTTEKGDWLAILEEVPVDDEGRAVVPPQREDRLAYSRGRNVDDRRPVRLPQVGNAVVDEAGGGSSGDRGDTVPHGVQGLPEGVEGAQVGGDDDGALARVEGPVQDRPVPGDDLQ